MEGHNTFFEEVFVARQQIGKVLVWDSAIKDKYIEIIVGKENGRLKFTNSAPTFLSGIRLVILQEEQTQATVVGNVSSNGMDVIFELLRMEKFAAEATASAPSVFGWKIQIPGKATQLIALI